MKEAASPGMFFQILLFDHSSNLTIEAGNLKFYSSLTGWKLSRDRARRRGPSSVGLSQDKQALPGSPMFLVLLQILPYTCGTRKIRTSLWMKQSVDILFASSAKTMESLPQCTELTTWRTIGETSPVPRCENTTARGATTVEAVVHIQ